VGGPIQRVGEGGIEGDTGSSTLGLVFWGGKTLGAHRPSKDALGVARPGRGAEACLPEIVGCGWGLRKKKREKR